ncbi:MAG: hypothetical protein WA215_11935 [Candidatus Cybelea sp.]
MFAALVFAFGVMFAAASRSAGNIVKEVRSKKPPDSIYILTKNSNTAHEIALAFRSAAPRSTYSLSVAEPLVHPTVLRVPLPPSPKGVTTQAYYLVSTYGLATLSSMVVLERYAVVGKRLGLTTVIGDDDSGQTGGGTTAGGTSFTTGATNSNTGGITDTLKGGIIGVAAIDKVREALQRINPALYNATLFNSHQVDESIKAINRKN